MLEFINLGAYKRWDMAGIDGLQVAKLWFGAAVDRMAPFQSLETVCGGKPCSVLRLCEANFRVSCPAHLAIADSIRHYRVWMKQFDWLSAIAVADATTPHLQKLNLQKLAIPKPPHRLDDLQPNRAIPARIDGIAVLIWRHSLGDRPVVELQAARKDLDRVRAKLL